MKDPEDDSYGNDEDQERIERFFKDEFLDRFQLGTQELNRKKNRGCKIGEKKKIKNDTNPSYAFDEVLRVFVRRFTQGSVRYSGK